MEGVQQNATDVLAISEQELLELAQLKVNGFTDKDIVAKLPNLIGNQKATIVNNLLIRGNLEIFTHSNGSLIYKLKDPSKVKIAKGSDNEEKVVYSIIEEAGNKGIWIRDIRIKSNLSQTSLSKVVKNLETKKIIKSVKSIAAARKKVFMLYELQPDRSITGGAWYQDQEYEAEFVDILNDCCYKYLQKQKAKVADCKSGPFTARKMSYVSSQDVWQHITDLKISKVALSLEDMEMILNTLVYDGKAEKMLDISKVNLYRAIEPLLSFPGLISSPCGVCPVKNNCCDEGEITPQKCFYFNQWLDY